VPRCTVRAVPDRKAIDTIDPTAFEPERVCIGDREIYARNPRGLAESKLVEASAANR
jgi:hypothetical protein